MKYIKTFEDINGKELFNAITTDDLNKVKELIDAGVDLNVKDRNGKTPLIVLAESLFYINMASKYNL